MFLFACLYGDRSSHWRSSVKKVVLRNFANFAKTPVLKSLVKKRLQRRCFLFTKYAKFLGTPILKTFCSEVFYDLSIVY